MNSITKWMTGVDVEKATNNKQHKAEQKYKKHKNKSTIKPNIKENISTDGLKIQEKTRMYLKSKNETEKINMLDEWIRKLEMDNKTDEEIKNVKRTAIFSMYGPQEFNETKATKALRRQTIIQKNKETQMINEKKRKTTTTKMYEKKLKNMDASKVKVKYNAGELLPNENLLCVVVPSGHGKTSLAFKHGWLDIDSCIAPEDHDELWTDRIQSLVDTGDWTGSQDKWTNRVCTTIGLMAIETPTIVLVHDYATILAIGGQYIGGAMVEQYRELKSYKERDESSKKLMDFNAGVVFDYPSMIMCDNQTELEQQIQRMVNNIGVPVAAPDDAWIENPVGYSINGMGSSELMDIENMIIREKAGQIPKCAVDYQVRKRSKSSYKGYGKCANDWAKVYSKMTIVENKHASLSERPTFKKLYALNLDELTHALTISDDDDVHMLLRMHKHDSVDFLINVLVYWKMFGIETECKEMIFKMLCVEEKSWDRMMNSLLTTLAQSDDILGSYVCKEDRNVIIGMRYMRSYEKGMLTSQVLKPTETITRQERDVTISLISSACSRIEHEGVDEVSINMPIIDKLLEQPIMSDIKHVIQTIRSKMCTNSAEMAAGTMKHTLKERVCSMLVIRLAEKWRNVGHNDQLIINSISRNIASVKFQMSSKVHLRDEWSEAIKKFSESKYTDNKIVEAIYAIMVDDFSSSSTDRDWETKLYDTIKALTAAGLCAEKLNVCTKLIGVKGIIPVVFGKTQGEVMKAMVQLAMPKHVSRAYGDEYNYAVYMAQKLCEELKSPYATTIATINAGVINDLSPRKRMAIMGHINEMENERCKEILSQLMFRKWYGRSITESDKKQISKITYTAEEDNGIGSFTKDCIQYVLEDKIEMVRVTKGTIRQGEGNQYCQNVKQNSKIVKKKKQEWRNKEPTNVVTTILDMQKISLQAEQNEKVSLETRHIAKVGSLGMAILNDMQQKIAWRYGEKQSNDIMNEIISCLIWLSK